MSSHAVHRMVQLKFDDFRGKIRENHKLPDGQLQVMKSTNCWWHTVEPDKTR